MYSLSCYHDLWTSHLNFSCEERQEAVILANAISLSRGCREVRRASRFAEGNYSTLNVEPCRKEVRVTIFGVMLWTAQLHSCQGSSHQLAVLASDVKL
jgi:hypothetical protein